MSAEILSLDDHRRRRQVARNVEPWLAKPQMAAHLGMSVRWLEQQTAAGMPSVLIGGRRRYRVSEVEAWLRNREGAA